MMARFLFSENLLRKLYDYGYPRVSRIEPRGVFSPLIKHLEFCFTEATRL